MNHKRTCAYCHRRASYEDLPDDTTVYLGVMVCRECLQKEVSKDFRELTGNEKMNIKEVLVTTMGELK